MLPAHFLNGKLPSFISSLLQLTPGIHSVFYESEGDYRIGYFLSLKGAQNGKCFSFCLLLIGSRKVGKRRYGQFPNFLADFSNEERIGLVCPAPPHDAVSAVNRWA